MVIFKVGDGERVVSVARLPEVADENGVAEEPADDENGNGNGNAEEPADQLDNPAVDEPENNHTEGDDR